jgi:hypothetical protein
MCFFESAKVFSETILVSPHSSQMRFRPSHFAAVADTRPVLVVRGGFFIGPPPSVYFS